MRGGRGDGKMVASGVGPMFAASHATSPVLLPQVVQTET